MIIHRSAGRQHSFGAALNTWMWRELHPALFDSADDGIRFIGIGAMLDQRLPAGGTNVVLGSGLGHALRPDMGSAPANWRIYGVRGPLTARWLNLPVATVLTDPAILLAGHARWQQPAPARRRVVFVPQSRSVPFGQWQAACALAGIEFVDPRTDPLAVIEQIAGASLVISESMHAAVVADALRVPWIPVVLSREVAPFHWADWAATLGVEYRPLLLAPSSPAEAMRNQVLTHSSLAHIDSFGFQARKDDGPRELAWSREQLLTDHRRSMFRAASHWRRRLSALAHAALKSTARVAPHTHQRVTPGLYHRYREQAAAQLLQAMVSPSHLSSDALHSRALSRCVEAVARLHADRRTGRCAGGSGHPPPALRAAQGLAMRRPS